MKGFCVSNKKFNLFFHCYGLKINTFIDKISIVDVMKTTQRENSKPFVNNHLKMRKRLIESGEEIKA